jgi:hypothetical protein
LKANGAVAHAASPLELLDPGTLTILSADLLPGNYVVSCPVGHGGHQDEGVARGG